MNSLASAVAKDRFECVVLDDDPDIRILIARVLSKIGISSLGLSSAEALARVMKEQHPAVVFLDVHLDHSDAIDGIRILKQGSFNGAVQLISGKDPTILLDIKAVGERNGLKMLDPLQKPFRSEQLRRIFDADANAGSLSAASAEEPEAAPMPSSLVHVDLEEALAAHWLDMAYQPKVDLVKNFVVGAEGLARINHPVHGYLGPQAFLPGASAAALNILTEFVVKKAFLDWEVLMGAGCNLRLAVNAPAEALIDPKLVNLVREHHPRNPRWPGLIMEVTEEEAVRNFDAVAEAAVQLKIYRVVLAIDDFGSGYSSFARLKQFPFAEIKLDRSYVQGCATDPVNARICQSIVELARATGADCVAEGIEAPADRDALIRLGCELGQGYLFGRPMSVGKLIERMAAGYSMMLADRQIR